jgi:hypothetical protein
LNRFQNTLAIGQNLVVPKTNDRKTLCIQPARSLGILCLLQRMLSAVGLDNQAPFVTNKIDDKPADLFLAAKFQSGHLSGSEVPP